MRIQCQQFLCQNILKTEQLSQMFQSFITSIDSNEIANKYKQEDNPNPNPRDSKLREISKNIILSMMNSRQICTQAALNIGLPSNILDFDKLLKFINSESNPSSLNFTYMQLKTLQKECNKLKKTITFVDKTKQPSRSDARAATRKDTLIAINEDQSKKQSDSSDKLQKAMQQQLALRLRLKHLSGNDKIERKHEILKKIAEKAKSMNKRAFKIYKNHKLKEQKSMDFFKIQTLYNNQQYQKSKQEVPPNLHEKKYIPTTKYEPSEYNEKSMDLLKVSIMRDEYTPPLEKCKTAGTKIRTRYIENTNETTIKRSSNDRFLDYKRRENQIRQKKQEIERSKQEQALYRLIKKNEKLNEVSLRNEQSEEKQYKKVQKLHQQSLNKHQIEELHQDFDISIRDKCQEKLLKKQLQLQEQVNRIREDLKAKQERRERHRIKKQRQHEQKLSLNELYLKNYISRCKQHKQDDYRHEMTIKHRHELMQEKQNDTKAINNLSKFTDQQLMRSIERLKKSDNSKSLFNLNQA